MNKNCIAVFTKNILIVEDHHILLEAYISKMQNYGASFPDLNFISATNCEQALLLIDTCKINNEPIDYAIIDVNLTPFNEIKSGIDLVFEIKNKHSNCKVLVLTSFTNPMAIYNLINTIEVKIVVCKSDIDASFFDKIFELFHQKDNYRSETINTEIENIMVKKLML